MSFLVRYVLVPVGFISSNYYLLIHGEEEPEKIMDGGIGVNQKVISAVVEARGVRCQARRRSRNLKHHTITTAQGLMTILTTLNTDDGLIGSQIDGIAAKPLYLEIFIHCTVC
jgi:hypothetical protein